MLEWYHQITQELHSVLPPHVNKRDIRHPSEKIMTYHLSPLLEPPEYVRDGVGDLELFGMERTGVTHLVHAWHQQGRKVRKLSLLHHFTVDVNFIRNYIII